MTEVREAGRVVTRTPAIASTELTPLTSADETSHQQVLECSDGAGAPFATAANFMVENKETGSTALLGEKAYGPTPEPSGEEEGNCKVPTDDVAPGDGLPPNFSSKIIAARELQQELQRKSSY